MWYINAANSADWQEWLANLPESDADSVRSFTIALEDGDEDPWYFKGVRDIVVGKAGFPYQMLYKALLRVDSRHELAIFFAVEERCFSKDGIRYQGTVHLLMFGELKSLRKRYSIESAAYLILVNLKEGEDGSNH